MLLMKKEDVGTTGCRISKISGKAPSKTISRLAVSCARLHDAIKESRQGPWSLGLKLTASALVQLHTYIVLSAIKGFTYCQNDTSCFRNSKEVGEQLAGARRPTVIGQAAP